MKILISILLIMSLEVVLSCNITDSFICEDGSCLKNEFKCNAVVDCEDGSDESHCANHTCKENYFQCQYGGCIHNAFVCNGIGECPDLSDETESVCADRPCATTKIYLVDNFRCAYGACIWITRVCNNITDCHDGSDETERACAQKCPEKFWRCDNGQCIPAYSVCDRYHRNNCFDTSDESAKACADKKCSKSQFKCNDGPCIQYKSYCNGLPDCRDGSDEKCIFTAQNWFRCGSGKLISWSEVCDGQTDCEDFSDEKNKNCSKWRTNIHCDNHTILPSSRLFCDGSAVCKDGIDEKQFRKTNQSDMAFPCQNTNYEYTGICSLPRNHVCNEHIDCRYGADECFCQDGIYLPNAHYHDNCFKCLNNALIIPQHKVCDGKIDCEDLSDECLCQQAVPECMELNFTGSTSVDIWSNYYSGDKLKTFMCCQDQNCRKNLPAEANCKLCVASIFDRLGILHQQYAISEDGIATCKRIKWRREECDFVKQQPGFCQSISEIVTVLDGSSICNGFDDFFNEENPAACAHRYFCNNSATPPINIAKHKVCDGVADCFDQSDEMNCNESTHYYCKSGNLDFISQDKVCNGREDCDDSSDECQQCLTSHLSSDEKLIANAGVWFLLLCSAITSLIGNLFRILMETRSWYRGVYKTCVCENNSILLCSLAAADFCVSIYLWGLLIANATTSHNQPYCLSDKEWRISDPCKFLGVLVFVGSQASLFTLVLIGMYRLKTVLSPMAALSERIRKLRFAIFMVWFVSLVFGLIPILTSDDYFITYVEYTTNPLMTKIDKANNSRIARNLLMITNNTGESYTLRKSEILMTWNEIEKTMKLIHPDLKIKYKYHYYSKHGTCLPDFYPNPSTDLSYAYSAGWAIFNAGCFLVLAGCYILAYRNTKKTYGGVQDRSELLALDSMQRKIVLITVTDMLCWLPVGIGSLCSLNGVTVTEEMYVATAAFILPINSVVNPLIYSDTLDMLLNKIKTFVAMFQGTNRNTN